MRGLADGDIKRLLEAVSYGPQAVEQCVAALCAELGLNNVQKSEILVLANKLSQTRRQVEDSKQHLMAVQQRTVQEQRKLAAMRASLPQGQQGFNQPNQNQPRTDFAYPSQPAVEGQGPNGGMRDGFTLPNATQRAAQALEHSNQQYQNGQAQSVGSQRPFGDSAGHAASAAAPVGAPATNAQATAAATAEASAASTAGGQQMPPAPKVGTFDGRKKISSDSRYDFSTSGDPLEEMKRAGRTSLLSEQLAAQIPQFDLEAERREIRAEREFYSGMIPKVKEYCKYVLDKEAEITSGKKKTQQYDTAAELNSLDSMIAGIQSYQQSVSAGVTPEAPSQSDSLKLSEEAQGGVSVMQALMNKVLNNNANGANSSDSSLDDASGTDITTDTSDNGFSLEQQGAYGYDVNDPRHLGSQLVSSISLARNDESIAPGGSFDAPPAPPQLQETQQPQTAEPSAPSSEAATAATAAAAEVAPASPYGSMPAAEPSATATESQPAVEPAVAAPTEPAAPAERVATHVLAAAGVDASESAASDSKAAESIGATPVAADASVSTGVAAVLGEAAASVADDDIPQASADEKSEKTGGEVVSSSSPLDSIVGSLSLSDDASNKGAESSKSSVDNYVSPVALSENANKSLAAMASSLASVEGHGAELSVDDIMGTDFDQSHGDMSPAAQLLSSKSKKSKDKDESDKDQALGGLLISDDDDIAPVPAAGADAASTAATSADTAAASGAQGGAATDSSEDDDLPPWELSEEEMKRFRKVNSSDALPEAASLSTLDHSKIFTNTLSGGVATEGAAADSSSAALPSEAANTNEIASAAIAVDSAATAAAATAVVPDDTATSTAGGSDEEGDSVVTDGAAEATETLTVKGSACDATAVLGTADAVKTGEVLVSGNNAVANANAAAKAASEAEEARLQEATSGFEKATEAMKSARNEDDLKALQQQQTASALDLLNSFGSKIDKDIELNGGNEPSPWDNIAAVTVLTVNGKDIKLHTPPKVNLTKVSDNNYLLDAAQASPARKPRIFDDFMNPRFGDVHDFSIENGTVEQYLQECMTEEKNLFGFEAHRAKVIQAQIDELTAQGQDFTKPHIDLLRLLGRSNASLLATLPPEQPKQPQPQPQQPQQPQAAQNVQPIQQPPMQQQGGQMQPQQGMQPPPMQGQAPQQAAQPQAMGHQPQGQFGGSGGAAGARGAAPQQPQGQGGMPDFGERPDYIAADDDYYSSDVSFNAAAMQQLANEAGAGDDDYIDDVCFAGGDGDMGGGSMPPMFDAAEAALDAYGADITPTEVVGSNLPAPPSKKAPAFKRKGMRLVVEDDFLVTLDTVDPWFSFLKKVYPDGGLFFSVLTGCERRIDPNDEKHWTIIIDQSADWGYISHNFWEDTRKRFEEVLGHELRIDTVTEPQVPRGAPIIEARFAMQNAIAKERQSLGKLDGLSKLMRMVNEDIANTDIELYINEDGTSRLLAHK